MNDHEVPCYHVHTFHLVNYNLHNGHDFHVGFHVAGLAVLLAFRLAKRRKQPESSASERQEPGDGEDL